MSGAARNTHEAIAKDFTQPQPKRLIHAIMSIDELRDEVRAAKKGLHLCDVVGALVGFLGGVLVATVLAFFACMSQRLDEMDGPMHDCAPCQMEHVDADAVPAGEGE